MPRYGLRVCSVKIGKQFGVSDMPHSRTVIGHGVSLAWDVVVARNITVVSLVKGLEPQEERWGFDSSGGPLA